ncbi:hypothetical protein [Burkholderia sp. PU8-34]
MMFKQKNAVLRCTQYAGAAVVALLMTACGGGGGDDPNNLVNTKALVLSGWYGCSASGTTLWPSTEVLATPHGGIYGQCADKQQNIVDVSASYTGVSGTVPLPDGATGPLAIHATLSNVTYYSTLSYSGAPAGSVANVAIPADTFNAVPVNISTNVGLNNSVQLQLTEAGTSSQYQASTFVVPSSLWVWGGPLGANTADAPVPANLAAYAGTYENAQAAPLSVNERNSQFSGALGGTVAVTIKSDGSLSGTIPILGSFMATVSAYDATTGVAEITGTAGSVSLTGAYAMNYQNYGLFAPTTGNSSSTSTETTYTPVALFLRVNGAMFEVLLMNQTTT